MRPADKSAGSRGSSRALPGQLENIGAVAGASAPAPRAAAPADFKPAVLAGSIAGPGASSLSPYRQTAHALDTKFKLKDFNGALLEANRMIDLEPQNHEGWSRRSEVENELAQYSQAEKDALEAVKRDPADAKAWKALAWARLKQGKAQAAKDAATLALAIDPNDPEAYLLRAYAEELLGEKDAALRDLAKAAELDARLKPKLEQAQAGGKIFDEKAASPFSLTLAAPETVLPGWAAAGLVGLAAACGAMGFMLWKQRRRASPVGRVDLTKDA
jgi:tetratricopeptide (TPR) repeat protein